MEQKRFIILIMSFGIAFSLLIGNLYALQIRDGEEHLSHTERKILRTTVIKAQRGEILDSYGRPLVVNRESFNLQIDKVSLGSNDLNELISELLWLLSANGETFTDTLMISGEPYAFLFDETDEESSELKKMLRLKEKLKLNANASATEVMEGLYALYKIPERLSPYEKRLIASIRIEMENRDFSSSYPFTLSENISIETVSKVKENQHIYKGAEIVVEPVREYVDGTVAPHIIGRVGSIYKEEYEELKEKGYQLNDIVGKDGVEKAFEEYLRGTAGVKTVEQNILGRVIGVKASVEPHPGNDVLLTLDTSLQQVASESLERNIQKIALNRGKGSDCDAGAVVVLDVNSGALLAAANYPTFDLSTFSQEYQNMLGDPAKPMINRSMQGLYEPGSTFKMLTAIAGLESGAISTSTRVTCRGVYEHFAPSYRPKCWIYNDYGGSHGTLDVVGAIQKSCNIFFFETSRLTGIETMNDYAKQFGLGEYTGIELPGEYRGILAGKENSEKRGTIWYQGNTVAAGIGQSDNLFTPLQLANYIATIANGGKRYEVHLLKEVKDSQSGETIFKHEPIYHETGVSQATIKTTIEGMRRVTEDGTASSVFTNYPISVAGKTGTAQVPTGTSNGVFVAFAPVENPEIAIAIVLEHGAHGNWAAPIAVDILDAYFAKDMEAETMPKEYIPLA